MYGVFERQSTKMIQKGLWITFISIGSIGLFNIALIIFILVLLLLWLWIQWVKEKNIWFWVWWLYRVILILLTIDYAVRYKFSDAVVNKYYLKVLLTFWSPEYL